MRKKVGMRVAGPGIFTETQRLRIHPKPFLKYFLPKGHELTRKNLQKVVKHFHLAFKGMELEEIYDVLMEQLVAAINGYDPCYKAKVKKVIEVINSELSKRKQFRALDVRRHLEFDCDKHLRLLCRRGFLEVVPAGEGDEGARFQRLVWPPPVEFTEGDGDIIGLAYYLQKWFRFGLQEWITKRSRELEAKEGVYSLEGWNLTRANHFAYGSEGGGTDNTLLEQVVSSDGDYRDDNGTTLSADVEMIRKASLHSALTVQMGLVNIRLMTELRSISSVAVDGGSERLEIPGCRLR